ncbi:acyl-homoserine-lactone synthase [Sphingoaurantiacus capsulatus]|uniref:Acyl-homoserine-lactone synthase n=1 Tax=Sphingoaurantiacus capsulatus TaxID=1771310 RepID=A0ABV7XHE5_9SPHN
MVNVITRHNRDRYQPLVEAMHVDRKRIFVDWLKWDVPVVEDRFEMDQFDTEDAVYLVIADPETGKHMGSVRLLPSTVPHLLSDVFPELVEGEVPRADDVWEITRMCTTPDIARSWTQVQVWRQLAVALVEFGLMAGIRQYTLITHMPFVPTLISAKWNCTPLGLPVEMDGVDVAALAVDVDAPTLARMRAAFGPKHSLLQLDDQSLPLAA